jgi:hypothetical protein
MAYAGGETFIQSGFPELLAERIKLHETGAVGEFLLMCMKYNKIKINK